MISRNRISFINSLKQKKFRQEHSLFVAEGSKIILVLLKAGIPIDSLYYTPDVDLSHISLERSKLNEITAEELKKISSLESPNQMLGVFRIQDHTFSPSVIESGFTLILDGIKDPGNLGTIIRIAHWYGIKNIICSPGTVDVFNSKVIQGTMGSVASVNVYYHPLTEVLDLAIEKLLPVYAAVMEGSDVHSIGFPENGLIILGSESHGISADLLKKENIQAVTIPPYNISDAPESLNVAIASAIILSSIRRN